MACNEHITPCTCVPYVSTGCLDTYDFDCVKYTGAAISCLGVASGDTLTDVLGHLEDVVCALSPLNYASYNYGCLSTENITTQEQFVESISGIICEILGSQVSGGITSLSSVATSLTTLSGQVTALTTVTTLDCFETLTALPGPTTTVTTILAAIQQLLCSHDANIVALQALGGVPLTVNDSNSIDLVSSGTANHTLTANARISVTANNAISIQSDGLYAQAVALTVADTPTIDLTASGTLNHTLQAAVKISTATGNQVIANADGIFVPQTTTNETVLTGVSSSNIQLSTSGVNGHTISAQVKLSPAAGNIISAASDGLYANSASITIPDNSITGAKLRDSVGYSVIGKPDAATGDPLDIVAAADTVLLRIGSGNITFGKIQTSNIGDDQVTLGKMQEVASQKILGRNTAGTGDIELLGVGSNMTLSGGNINTLGRTLIAVKRFTTNGTWTKSTGTNAIEVVIVGGGGGGAGANASASQFSAGSGGGGGGYARYFFTSLFGASETVTIGAGGVAGIAGNAYVGQNGGNTLFGTIAQANGGLGGATIATGTSVLSALGGQAGANTVPAGNGSLTGLVFGGSGSAGMIALRTSLSTGTQGRGGTSAFGGNGDTAPGGGGDGNIASNGTTADGMPGGPGMVIVYEYS